jgi:hypothetical protein
VFPILSQIVAAVSVCASQFEGSEKRDWVWVPHDCYHHLYSKQDLYGCAAKTDVAWIHAMGDSQEREFVSVLKMINGSVTTVTPYIAVRHCVCETFCA